MDSGDCVCERVNDNLELYNCGILPTDNNAGISTFV